MKQQRLEVPQRTLYGVHRPARFYNRDPHSNVPFNDHVPPMQTLGGRRLVNHRWPAVRVRGIRWIARAFLVKIMDKYNYRAYEILEFKAKILRMSVAVACGFVVVVLLFGLFGGLR